MDERRRKTENSTLTLYLVIVGENLPWLLTFIVISVGALTCGVLESLGLMTGKTLTTVAVSAFLPWLVSLVVFLADATSRNSEGKKLTTDE